MENHSMIERIKKQDSENGLKEIYSKYRDEFLLWAIRNHSCSMEEAKDVFQQTVIIFYENIVYGKVSEITTKVKTYLFSIGKNKLLELIRKKGKHLNEFKDQAYSGSEIYYGDEYEEYEGKLKKVELCLEKLGDPCKGILKQYYYQKRSMQEIAKVLDYKNSDTVKNLKYKCLQRLRQVFTSDFGDFNEHLL